MVFHFSIYLVEESAYSPFCNLFIVIDCIMSEWAYLPIKKKKKMSEWEYIVIEELGGGGFVVMYVENK